MSLSSEERNTIVALELKKAREAYEDIGILPLWISLLMMTIFIVWEFMGISFS